MDEPSIGLHPRDNGKLIKTLKKLRDLGNTVIVVEHDQETMEESDFYTGFWTGSRESGGEITAQGTVSEIKKNEKSLTGKYLSNKRKIQILSNKTENPPDKNLRIIGARQHNLKNIDVIFRWASLL